MPNKSLERTVANWGHTVRAVALLRGPVRNRSCGRPFNGIVSRHQERVSAAIPFLVPCGIIAVASIPLILGVVPPNNVYGFRTRQTLADPALWLRANRFAGLALFIAAAASAAIVLAVPEYASGRSLTGLFIFVTPLILAVALSFAYLRRIGAGAK
jgi:hypothetical protein